MIVICIFLLFLLFYYFIISISYINPNKIEIDVFNNIGFFFIITKGEKLFLKINNLKIPNSFRSLHIFYIFFLCKIFFTLSAFRSFFSGSYAWLAFKKKLGKYAKNLFSSHIMWDLLLRVRFIETDFLKI